MTRAISIRALLVAIVVYSLFAFAMPQRSLAFGTAADAMCNGTAQCPDHTGPGENGPCSAVGGGTIGRACHDPGSNVTGVCTSSIPGKCEAMNAPGLGGKGNALDSGLSQLGSILGQLMSKLMSGGGGGGSGSGSGAGGSGTPGCTAQPTSDMSIYQSNPTCYYYVAPVSASLGANTTGTGLGSGTSISDQLGSLFNTGTSTDTNTNTNTNVSDALNNLGGTTQTAGQTNATTTATTSSSAVLVPTNAANLLPGFRGDIQVLGSGATILGGQRDSSSNSETSGFFGVNTLGGQGGTGIVANLCQARPWASGLFSKLIPATFFDGLCSMRGYQVGAPQPVTTAPQVTVTQTKPKPVVTTTTAATSTSTVPPKVDIWAVPAKVNLGARTSIFWNTQGVTQCTETSPDGSFSQTSLSGGASTVPITTATTFTISCLAPDGSHISDYVTVDLNI